jgi:hypothetical protein
MNLNEKQLEDVPLDWEALVDWEVIVNLDENSHSTEKILTKEEQINLTLAHIETKLNLLGVGLGIWIGPINVKSLIEDILTRFCGVHPAQSQILSERAVKEKLQCNHLAHLNRREIQNLFGLSIGETIEFQKAARIVFIHEHLMRLTSEELTEIRNTHDLEKINSFLKSLSLRSCSSRFEHF